MEYGEGGGHMGLCLRNDCTKAIVNRSDGFLNMTRIVASMHITRVGMAVCKIRRSVCTTSVVFTLASIMYYAYIHT